WRLAIPRSPGGVPSPVACRQRKSTFECLLPNQPHAPVYQGSDGWRPHRDPAPQPRVAPVRRRPLVARWASLPPGLAGRGGGSEPAVFLVRAVVRFRRPVLVPPSGHCRNVLQQPRPLDAAALVFRPFV